MDRASKIALLTWAAVALAAQTVLGRTWPGMPLAAALACAASALLATLDRRSVALVLAPAYCVPAIIRLGFGTWDVQYYPLFTAALLGMMLPDGLRTRWHVPPRLRAPLVCAALATAVAVPIVAWREIDFNAALLAPSPYDVLSGLPAFVVAWTLHVGLTLVLGVLWFDWLLGATSLDFDTWVLAPLGVGLLGLVAVAIYQLVGDITFLNETVYAAGARAGGTLFDANVSGVVAAMGLGGALYALERTSGVAAVSAAVLVAGLWLAVWASGSRTAFAAAAIITLSGAVVLARSHRHRVPQRAWLLATGIGVLLVALGTLGLVSASGSSAIGPLRRLRDTLPAPSVASVRAFAAEMWNRNGYGAVSTTLIAEHPIAGLGVGAFHGLGPVLAGVALPPDNAQNWFRHQLVEMGLLGAAGWLAFAVVLGWMVVRPPRTDDATPMARAVLVAFGAISMFGVPTQEIPAALTFWTAAAWFVLPVAARDTSRRLSPFVWLILVLVVVSFGVATLRAARTDLRVPHRARTIGWPYAYGFYWPEPDGRGGEQRWAARRAAALVDVTGPIMTLSVHVNHADIAERPVDVKAWVDGRLVLQTRLTSVQPAQVSTALPAGVKRTLVETWVSRVVHPRAIGVDDGRELGLLVGWVFSGL